jgi:hypothetical protein
MYDTYQQRIIECDQQLQKYLASFSKTILSSPPEAGGLVFLCRSTPLTRRDVA